MPVNAPDAPLESRRLMIVDDDLLSREVLGLLATEAGFEVACYESGEAALEGLDAPGAEIPHAVLADMQMPGVSGDSFARLLRAACGASTRLVAMSGSKVAPDRASAFDAFLLKPFSMDEFSTLLDSPEAVSHSPAGADHSGILSAAIFSSFSQSMSALQVRQLYTMCLDDADARIGVMRRALSAADDDAFRRAAHSIKGGCGMVGALELARLAAAMEENRPNPVDSSVTLDEFLIASAHLRRILDAQLK